MTVNWDTDKIAAAVRSAALEGVIDGTEAVKAAAIAKILGGTKSGIVYRRRGVFHQASAPGESPASDTGKLAQSGRTRFDTVNIIGEAIFSTAYAAALEFGTAHTVQAPFGNQNAKNAFIVIKPRPYARVSLEEERPKIIKNIEKLIKRAIG